MDLKHLDDEICRLYSGGMKQKDIAKQLLCSQQKVSLVLVERNLGKGKGGYQWNDAHFHMIRALASTHTSSEIAEILHIGAKNVQKKIRLYKKKGLLSENIGRKRGEVKLNFFFVDGRESKNRKHHNQSRIYRGIVESMIGRELSADEHVHHIDGDASNNDPGNLVVLTEEQHRQLHMAILHKLHQARKAGTVFDLQQIENEVLDTLKESESGDPC